MEKRFLFTAIIVALLSLTLAGAVPTGAVVYGDSSTVIRSTSLPTENVHIEAQQQETIASLAQLDALKINLDEVQRQMDAVRVATENQRTEVTSQLTAINRELGAIKASVDSLQAMQEQVSALRPALEQPREIIPPNSLVFLAVANVILLIVTITLIFWLRAQWKGSEKESHLEEHAQIHLTEFIREAMHKGASLAEIRKRLSSRGWSEGKIDEAIQEVRTMHAA